MDWMVYLLSLSISGVKNIEKEIKIEFAGKSVNSRFNPEKNRVKCIFGENGTGKTAIVTAVDIVRSYILNSNYLRDSKNQLLLKELISKSTREFVFKCEFITNIELLLIYEYEVRFSIDNNDEVYISYESMSYKRNSNRNKQVTLFVCENGELVYWGADVENQRLLKDITKNLLRYQSALF